MRLASSGRRGGAALATVAVVSVVSAVSVGSGDGVAGAVPPYAVGRHLTVADSDPQMQPVHMPSRVAVVATRPGATGAAQQEAWAAGQATAPSTQPGYDNASVSGQEVFLHHDRGGWVAAGPPVRADGTTPLNVVVSTMSLAASGEGWAVASDYRTNTPYVWVMLHHPAGAASSPWQLDTAASAAVENMLGQAQQAISAISISIGSPGEAPGGTFGYAVLAGSRSGFVMRLQNGQWAADGATGSTPGGNGSGQLGGLATAVATVSADDAWAGGSAYSLAVSECQAEARGSLGQGPPGGWQPGAPPAECMRKAQAILLKNAGSVIYHRSGGAWQAVDPTTLPAVAQGGRATTLASDAAGGVWVAGDTDNTPQITVSPAPVQPKPFVLHIPASGDATAAQVYCDLAVPGCSRPGSLPLGGGTPLAISVAPSSSGGPGDVFVATMGPSALVHLPESASTFQEEPITVGAIGSMAFFAPAEGWAAVSQLDADAGVAKPLLGHWTSHPDAAEVARWPSPVTGQFTAVAADPGGSGVLMATGSSGIWRLEPRTGLWSQVFASGEPLRSISWPAHGDAWAVGGRSLLHFDGSTWRPAGIEGALQGDLESVAVLPAPLPPVVGRAGSSLANSGRTLVNVASVSTIAGGGTLLGWGGDASGQLGDGGTAASRPITAAAGLPGGAIAVAAGGDDNDAHSLGIACPCVTAANGRLAGTVFAWGDNTMGQLGLGTVGGKHHTPTAVAFPAGAPTAFVAVAAGANHSLAVGADGSVWAWGDDTRGQVGDGSAAPPPGDPLGQGARPTPVQVTGLSGRTITAVAAGAEFSLALAGDGTVWGWGTNEHGQLGTVSNLPSSESPTAVQIPALAGATAIAAGSWHALAVAPCPQGSTSCATGTPVVYGWGDNTFSQVPAMCAPRVVGGPVCPPQPVPMPGSAKGSATAVAAAQFGSLAVVGGTVYQWGQPPGHQGTPILPSPAPVPWPAAAPVTAVAMGGYSTGSFGLAQQADGSVWAWGANDLGQLGQDKQTVPSSATPLRLPGIDGLAIAAGRDQALAVVPTSTVPGALPTPTALPTAPPGPARALQGYAVGAGGTVVRFDGQRWEAQQAPSQRRLLAVAASGRDFVAAGDDGTLLVDSGSGWATAPLPPQTATASQSCGQYPKLLAVAALPDGTVLVGGARSTLLERDAADGALAFHVSGLPSLEGVVHGLALRRDGGGRLHVLATVAAGGSSSDTFSDASTDACAARPADYTGWLLAGVPGGWRDTELADVNIRDEEYPMGSGPPNPSSGDDVANGFPVQRDAVQGVLLDPSGYSGWAVGNRGSLWRVGLNPSDPGLPDYAPSGPQRSPMEAAAPPAAEPGAVASFAFLANTGCLQGSCTHQLGWGSRGDVVAVEALRAIDRAARAGTVAFVAGGGDLRRTGDHPHDLEAMRGLFDSLPVPVYQAVGAKDLNTSSTGSGRDSTTWQQTFAGRAAPWGAGAAPAGITPFVDGQGATAAQGMARTHYAFDHHGPGGTVRIIVADTSLGGPVDANHGQNPPDTSETLWLQRTLQDAARAGVPAVLVMNQPVVGTGARSDDPAVGAVLPGTPLLGVLASAEPPNQRQPVLPGTPAAPAVDAYMFGSGGGRFSGAQVGAAMPVDPSGGYYFAWQLASVVTTPSGAPMLKVRSIPVLDSVAMGAPAGTSVAQGGPIRFTGSGRLPDVGHYDSAGLPGSEYTPPSLSFPFHAAAPSVVPPDYHFVSDDNAVLVPVREDPARTGRPAHPITYDETSGLFCALRPGTAMLRLQAGSAAAQLPVTVTGASGGECGPPVTLPPPVPKPAKVVPVQPAQPHPAPPGPAAVVAPAPPHIARGHAPNTVVGGVVPPPAEVVPAPPGGGGVGQSVGQREEEEESEAATENANMTALRHQRADDPSWLPIGAAALGVGLAGYCVARGRRRRAGPVRAAVVTAGDARWRDRYDR